MADNEKEGEGEAMSELTAHSWSPNQELRMVQLSAWDCTAGSAAGQNIFRFLRCFSGFHYNVM